jgi:heme-degrading monooxygenase HmoA
MHARVGTGPVRPDQIDDAIRIVRESIYPVSKEQPGFRGAYFLVDRAAGRIISISLWETEADLRAGETGGYLREQEPKMAPLLGTPHLVERWEVGAQAQGGEHTGSTRTASPADGHSVNGCKAVYARVGTVQYRPDKIDEVLRRVRDSVYPAAQQRKGFHGAYYLVDRATGQATSISLWDTEADMLADEAGYLREQQAKTASLVAGSHSVEHYEVAART